MSLLPGVRLGPYEILSSIGAGGMGEVYRARDTRLDRTVAIKILPTHLSSSSQARERFDREAKAISSLSHPHICPLYDVGHQDGIDFLVMEYLEGETLAHRLKKGPLPPDQVLQYAIQITDALDTAHRHGVIHRDLKPGNIMLTKSGAKLLDFGLAKMQAAEAAAGMTQLPTQTTPLTAEGTILGTMQYMAPEQLEGQEADARTDIFALGAVLYEMATGRRAFEGKSRASLIAAILERDPPPVSSLQPLTSPALDHVVRTCMAKDPDARWQGAHDVLVELKWISDTGSQPGTAASAVSKGKARERILWAVVVALLSVALAFVHFNQRPAESHAVRFQFPLPEKTTTDWFGFPVVSPDGQRVVLPGVAADGSRHLWLRSLDSLTGQLLPGTEEAYLPFWSPDSRSVAFFTNTKLKRIDAAGGPAQSICDVAFPTGGGTWSRNGVIAFSGTNGSAIYRVSAAGGEPKPVIQLDKSRQQTSMLLPQFLPDGRHFLYLSEGPKHGVYVASLDAAGTPILIPDGSAATYASPGFLIYLGQDTLLARPFDAARLQFTGDPVPIAEHVGRMSYLPAALASISQNGVLAYSASGRVPIQLAWHTREGAPQAAVGEPGVYEELDLSPDERRLALKRYNTAKEYDEIWILEIPTGIQSRLISYASDEPHWSPDSKEIVFSSTETEKHVMFRKAIGGGDQTLVFQTDDYVFASQWLPDGTVLLQGDRVSQVLPSGDRKPVLLVNSNIRYELLQASPNGKWVAYDSEESGRKEVYAASFPSFKDKRQVSSGGGCQPEWRKDGKELFYLSLDGRMMSVTLKGDTSMETSAPKALFRASIRVDTINSQYAVSKDGTRFLFGDPVGEENRSITVVLNWRAGLKR